MNKVLAILAFVVAVAALVTAVVSTGSHAPRSNTDNAARASEDYAALEARFNALEREHQALRQSHESLAAELQRRQSAATPATLEADVKDLKARQAELEEMTQGIDQYGIIQSLEADLVKAYNTLMDTNQPIWTRAKQAGELKKFGVFDERAVNVMMDLWNQVEDHNEKSGILWAMRDVPLSPAFRDEILNTLSAEVERDYPSPKFRHMALETLEPMRSDPAVERWIEHLAANDPDTKLQSLATRLLAGESIRK